MKSGDRKADAFRRALDPFRWRLTLARALPRTLIGLIVGAGFSLTLLVISRFFLVPGVLAWALGLVAALPACFLFAALLVPIPDWAAARAADQAGLSERAITALEFIQNDEPLLAEQRADAARYLAAADPVRAVPLNFPGRLAGLALALILASGALASWPNPIAERAQARERERAEAARLADQVAKTAAEAAKLFRRQSPELHPRVAEALERLARLEEELRKAVSKTETQRALAGAAADLTSLKSGLNPAARDGAQLTRALARNPKAAGAARKLAAGDIKSSLKELKEAQASAASSGDSGTAAALGQLAGRLGSLAEPLEANQQLGSLSSSLSSLARSTSGSLASGGGSGAGTGSTNHAGSGGNSFGAGQSGWGAPPDSRGTFEKIYAPSLLGGDGKATGVQGSEGQGSEDIVETPAGPVTAGDLRPYDEVYSDYAEQARSSLDRRPIPAGVRDLVRRYFTAIQP